MIMTIQELLDLNNGIACDDTIAYLNNSYTGWTPALSVDVLTYMEGQRSIGMQFNVIDSTLKFLSDTQMVSFISWCNIQLDGITLSTTDQNRYDTVQTADMNDFSTGRKIRKLVLTKTACSDDDILTELQSIIGVI